MEIIIPALFVPIPSYASRLNPEPFQAISLHAACRVTAQMDLPSAYAVLYSKPFVRLCLHGRTG